MNVDAAAGAPIAKRHLADPDRGKPVGDGFARRGRCAQRPDRPQEGVLDHRHLHYGAVAVCYLPLAKRADATAISFYALVIAFIGNAGYAPVLIFLNERFPTAIRATGTGLSWNIGFALGGMMPTFLSLASAGTAQISMSLAVFAVGVFAIYTLGAILSPETKGEFRLEQQE
jgi:hypothetical protein